MALIPDNGTVAWYGDSLRRPTLPIMDIYGDVIGTDGHSLVMYDSDGKIVKPQISLGENLYPTYRYDLTCLYLYTFHHKRVKICSRYILFMYLVS